MHLLMPECFCGEREKPFKSNVASCARSGRAHTCGAHARGMHTHTPGVYTRCVRTRLCFQAVAVAAGVYLLCGTTACVLCSAGINSNRDDKAARDVRLEE